MATVKAGDKIKISSGAKYTNGKSVPQWVINDVWIVSSVSGSTVLIDKNTSGTNSIRSTINEQYITLYEAGVGSGSGSDSGSGTGTETSGPVINDKKITNVTISRIAGTDTLVAEWTWHKDHTEKYEYRWYYDARRSDGSTQKNILDNEGSVEANKPKNCSYTMPTGKEITKLWFHVRPVAQQQPDKTDTPYWTADWSDGFVWSELIAALGKPSAPTVEIKDYTMTITADNLDRDQGQYKHVMNFEIIRDNESRAVLIPVDVKYTHAELVYDIEPGHKYKVRCQLVRYSLDGTTKIGESEWSDFSTNENTVPAVPDGFTVCRANSVNGGSGSVYLEWSAVDNATKYNIQYIKGEDVDYQGAMGESFFESTANKNTAGPYEHTTFATISGLEAGHIYFFRLNAENDKGVSQWSAIAYTTIGSKPNAPSTWSSTTMAIIGEPLFLYWVHNAEDNSNEVDAQIELTVNGSTISVTVPYAGEANKNQTQQYSVDISQYSEGAELKWRVRTKGITNEYGDWSVMRTVKIYAQPSIAMMVRDTPNGEPYSTVESFPFYITATTQPTTQTPIGYYVDIVANGSYETIDSVGNTVIVSEGESVYSNYIGINTSLVLELNPSLVDLANEISYTVNVSVSMDSGLSAEATSIFSVHWIERISVPDAEVIIDRDILAASIHPFCRYASGLPVEDVLLSVYRKEYDGRFTKIVDGVENTYLFEDETTSITAQLENNSYIIDPHPALDFARYRIVATSKSTGAISFYDTPAYPVKEHSIVVQWNEVWQNFSDDQPPYIYSKPWDGSMLKLPYNVDVTDSYGLDVSMVNYIGRKHPVSYYGTQLGETSSMTTLIDKKDKETIYALRRLAIWPGNVYIREPNGTGYWANVRVSFSIKHLEVTIPVTLSITRVEGGT